MSSLSVNKIFEISNQYILLFEKIQDNFKGHHSKAPNEIAPP